MIMDELEKLKGRRVEITYNGVLYRGTLVGAGEDEISLKTQNEWLELPMAGVTAVRAESRLPFDGLQIEEES